MSFDDYLKKQTWNDRICLLIHRNAWRNDPMITKQNYIYKTEGPAKDGVRLAEIMNPITENI